MMEVIKCVLVGVSVYLILDWYNGFSKKEKGIKLITGLEPLPGDDHKGRWPIYEFTEPPSEEIVQYQVRKWALKEVADYILMLENRNEALYKASMKVDYRPQPD